MEALKFFEQLQRESTIFGSLKRQSEKTKYLHQIGFSYHEVDAIIMKHKGNK